MSICTGFVPCSTRFSRLSLPLCPLSRNPSGIFSILLSLLLSLYCSLLDTLFAIFFSHSPLGTDKPLRILWSAAAPVGSFFFMQLSRSLPPPPPLHPPPPPPPPRPPPSASSSSHSSRLLNRPPSDMKSRAPLPVPAGSQPAQQNGHSRNLSGFDMAARSPPNQSSKRSLAFLPSLLHSGHRYRLRSLLSSSGRTLLSVTVPQRLALT